MIRSARWLSLLGLTCLVASGCMGGPPRVVVPPTARPVDEAELRDLYAQAEAQLEKDNKQRALEISMRCVERATVAEQQKPQRAFPPYFRALCQTVKARVKTFGARSAAYALEKDAKEAVKRDESYDGGGPLRLLGMLYLRAPRWPRGPGDVEKGTDLLRRARLRYPSNPLNRLFYAEALVANGEPEKAIEELKQVDQAQLAPKWRVHTQRLREEASSK